MNLARLRSLLERYRTGAIGTDEVVEALKSLPFDDLGYGSVILGLETWDSGGAIWSIDDFVVREVE